MCLAWSGNGGSGKDVHRSFLPNHREVTNEISFQGLLTLFCCRRVQGVAFADLYWSSTATNTRVSVLNNWNTTATGTTHPTAWVADTNYWVNRSTGQLPTITSTYYFAYTLWDFNIGCTGAAAAAGKVTQTSGTTTITDDLNIGFGAIRAIRSVRST